MLNSVLYFKNVIVVMVICFVLYLFFQNVFCRVMNVTTTQTLAWNHLSECTRGPAASVTDIEEALKAERTKTMASLA